MVRGIEITGEWLNDPYVNEQLHGSTKTTKAGYGRDFQKWLDFVGYDTERTNKEANSRLANTKPCRTLVFRLKTIVRLGVF